MAPIQRLVAAGERRLPRSTVPPSAPSASTTTPPPSSARIDAPPPAPCVREALCTAGGSWPPRPSTEPECAPRRAGTPEPPARLCAPSSERSGRPADVLAARRMPTPNTPAPPRGEPVRRAWDRGSAYSFAAGEPGSACTPFSSAVEEAGSATAQTAATKRVAAAGRATRMRTPARITAGTAVQTGNTGSC
jgi:hypothetical protein